MGAASVGSPAATRIPPALGRTGRRDVAISRLAAPVSRTRRRDRVHLIARAARRDEEFGHERAPRRRPGRAPPADFNAADTWDDRLEWPQSGQERPPSYDRRESDRDASPSGSGRRPDGEERFGNGRGERRRESRYTGARDDFGYDDWTASEPRGAYDDEWRGSRMGGDRGGDRESGRAGWNPSEALPGVMGAATKAALAACSTMSDVTARALAGIFPRSIPMATLRTLSYLLWGFLFFAVFQRVISGFVLVGGLLLLAVAVAQGEMSLGNRGDPRDGRAWGAAFGSRGSNFDEFRDRRRKERRRKGAEDFFGRAAAAAGGAPMMEWWNERVEYERDFYSYPQNDEPEGNPRYDDGDVGASRQDKAESDEAHRRRSYDLDGDYVDVTPPPIDWSKLADTVRQATRAEEFSVVNEGIKMAGEAVKGFQGTFEGAGAAGEAGFSFSAAAAGAAGDTTGVKAQEPVATVGDEVPVAGDVFDDEVASEPAEDATVAYGQTVVEAEASAVSIDEWFSRGSTDSADDDAPGPRTGFEPPREGGASYQDPSPRWTAGTYRDPNGPNGEGSGRGEGGYERSPEWGTGAPLGRDRGGVGRNRWREFVTGRFYGEFQEDLIAARFDRAAGLAVEDDAKDGETAGNSWEDFDDDEPSAGAVR